MTISPDDPRFVYLAESKAVDASGHCDVIRDAWFCVHPEKGLMFWQDNLRRRKGSLTGARPQCNRNEALARDLCARMYPWAEVKQIPLVIVPIDVSDY